MPATTHTIINGDSRDMGELPDESVHLIVTSPPYWQLKDYGADAQIGFNDTYETYVNNLNLVWRECFRVLHNGCRLCVNIGDQFARSTYYGRYKIIPIHAEVIRACENTGFDFMGQIIWQKTTTMNTSGGAAIMGSFPCPRNGIVKLDFEYILLFKKQGTAPTPTREQKETSKMTTQEWNTFFNGHWYFAGAKQEKHLAMFPEELPRRLIKMFSFPGETVLDPFLGSGTTAAAAQKLGRNSICYEINPEFIPIIKRKIGDGDVFSSVEIIEKKQPPLDTTAFKKRISEQQFPFVDVHKLDKKVDVKKLQYGSRIDAVTPAQREEFFTVKEIISPELLRLNNDLQIRLIGIKENPAVNGHAVAFLREKLNGERVFLRYDTTKYDAENNLCVYLYLANKTFINAHLLKNNLALPDNTSEHRLREKFFRIHSQTNTPQAPFPK
ncbi:MAG: site-specific DNA-methyltransferase [Puniceicoccales bacterium]|jgi:site-specific DNA-methyltransferase (adenine-specific)|nr:site-specific DNA-methyltransferase [Puniceicoccales bacterium]